MGVCFVGWEFDAREDLKSIFDLGAMATAKNGAKPRAAERKNEVEQRLRRSVVAVLLRQV